MFWPTNIRNGMAYVMALINAVVQAPEWSSTAIFLAWDDWGRLLQPRRPTGRRYLRPSSAGLSHQPMRQTKLRRPQDLLIRLVA